jgi:hypothetical protein
MTSKFTWHEIHMAFTWRETGRLRLEYHLHSMATPNPRCYVAWEGAS